MFSFYLCSDKRVFRCVIIHLDQVVRVPFFYTTIFFLILVIFCPYLEAKLCMYEISLSMRKTKQGQEEDMRQGLFIKSKKRKEGKK